MYDDERVFHIIAAAIANRRGQSVDQTETDIINHFVPGETPEDAGTYLWSEIIGPAVSAIEDATYPPRGEGVTP